MKKACIVVHNTYANNKLFDLSDKIINRDNCMYPFWLLKEKFEQNGYELSTQDINSIEKSEIVIYNEMPKTMPKSEDKEKSYLLIFESELIRPDNWDISKHKCFDKIFTWKDDIIDKEKYFKLNFSQDMPKSIKKDLLHKNGFCTLIAGNKKVNNPLELYSKRTEAIKWFEANHIEDFDFYGIGWDKYNSSNKYINYILGKTKLQKLFVKNYPSYQGKVDNKRETLEKYKFSICYENAKDIPGYITEKIFDCFFAGCIPIYWGANNITKHIPKECFIDKREFENYETLYEFIFKMEDQKYFDYLNSIENFLNSDESFQFSNEYFVQTIIDNI